MREKDEIIVDKIVKTIFSFKNDNHIRTVGKWLKNLKANGTIDSTQHYIYGEMLVGRIDNLITVNQKEIVILDLMGKVALIDVKPDRAVVEVVKQEILKYFGSMYKNTYKNINNVYKLPLRINLVESVIHEEKQAAKVYLQKPGMLIGRGGRILDAIAENVGKRLGIEGFTILIAETFGD